ncbi:MAG: chemotaxis protein CheD [Candidatus Omnitrophota bacterium]
MEELRVKMADMIVAKAPHVLSTLGLGSCLGIMLYDSKTKIGGMAHVMLPDINAVSIKTNRAKFVNTAIEEMLREIVEQGAERKNITAKIAGGAHMFSFAKPSVIFDVGRRNITEAHNEFKRLGIKLIAEDVGLDYGRSVIFNLEDGSVKITTIAHGGQVI